MKRAATATILALMLLQLCAVSAGDPPVTTLPALRDPPPSGDWIVSAPESYSGISIPLAGNLTVTAGGSLTLSNVRLSLASPGPGALHIEVQSGAEMIVTDRDGNPASPDDATVISSATSHSYQFWVRPGGRLVLRNSMVKNCGYSIGSRGETAGLYLQSGNCDISNSTFRDNFCGIVVDGCAPRLDNCTFTENTKYGMEIRDADLLVGCNLFDQNGAFGLNLTRSRLRLERDVIRGNLYNGVSALCSTLSMDGNVFQLNKWRAVYAERSSVSSRKDEFYQNQLGYMLKGSSLDIEGAILLDNPYSLHCEDARVVMRNTTMVNSTLNDIWLTRSSDHSEVMSYNCTFKKVGFNDQNSWLEVRWKLELDVAWESNISPVKAGVVRFFDHFGNNLFNLTTNDTGGLPALDLSQYRERQSGRTESSPYRLGIFKDSYFNATIITLDRDLRTTLFLDNVPPYFTLTGPKENYTTNRSWINLTGGFQSDNGAKLEINGTPAEPDRRTGNFSVRVNLTEGKNVINVTAIDGFGNVCTVFRTVNRDSTPPSLEINIPQEGILTNKTFYDMSGRTDPGSYININGMVPEPSDDGRFEMRLFLQEGQNGISISSADQYQNRAWANRTIIVDTIAPVLDILSPPFSPISPPPASPARAENWTNRPNLRLLCRTEAGAAVYLAGAQLQSSGTNLSISINLTEGENLLQLSVRDGAGNWNFTTVLVHLDTVSPSANITVPGGGLPLNRSIVTFTGLTESGVIVSSRDCAVTQEGTDFQLACNLVAGPNFMTIELRDRAGNVRKMVLNVTVDLEASFRLDRPMNYTSTIEGSIRVEGRSEPGAVVSVNGQNVSPAADGSFTCVVRLKMGPNVIMIEVLDPAGNSASYQIVVYRTEPVPADTGWLVFFGVGAIIILAVVAVGSGSLIILRRRAPGARPARPAPSVMPWEMTYERPVLRAQEEPEEALRCAQCLQPVSEDWMNCHTCGGPTDLLTVSSHTFARLAEAQFQTERERGLAAALMKARSDIMTINEAGEPLLGKLREVTIAAQMLLRGQRLEIVERTLAGLGSELGARAETVGAAHAQELARTRQEAHVRMKALLDEVEGALPLLRESGADVRDIERAMEMARVHLRADNLEKAYEFIVEAKGKADGLAAGGPPRLPAT